jgi:hypothetical protein
LSPAEVVGWVTNKLRTPEQLHRIFYAMRFLRRLNRQGYVHFRRWKLYGEMALARQPALMRVAWGCAHRRIRRNPTGERIPFATNRITSISRACQKPSASRPPIAHRKADSGNWMRRYGTWLNGSLIMLPEDDGENRACIFSLHYLKSRKARK